MGGVREAGDGGFRGHISSTSCARRKVERREAEHKRMYTCKSLAYSTFDSLISYMHVHTSTHLFALAINAMQS